MVRPLTFSVLLFFGLVACLEWRLAQLGYSASVVDTSSRWIRERERATTLGNKALILVGASRIQLGLDLDTLASDTGLTPVQLAVDGSSGIPVLAGLAADPRVNGIVLIDYYDHMLSPTPGETASRYQRKFDAQRAAGPLNEAGERMDEAVSNFLHEHMLSYTQGASPYQLVARAFTGQRSENYISMAPDRSERADYELVEMPEFYRIRVMRTLGTMLPLDTPGLEERLTRDISVLQPASNSHFVAGLTKIQAMVKAIEDRGGRVLFVKMPSSGLIEKYEQRKYPRELFWDPMVAIAGIKGVRAADDPGLKSFKCPDGSHLDFRDRVEFTRRLVIALGLSRTPPA